MPDAIRKKPMVSVSSAEDPLVDDDVEIGAGAGAAGQARLLCCLVTSAALAVLLAVSVGALVYLLVAGAGAGRPLAGSAGAGAGAGAAGDARFKPLYVNLVVDVKAGVQPCAQTLSASRLPCLNDSRMIVGDAALGPLKCLDDAHALELKHQQQQQQPPQRMSLDDNCRDSPFVLARDRTGVIIPETGVYRVHSTVTFVDELPYYVSSSIRVDPASCIADPSCWESQKRRDNRAHTWLACAVHNSGPGAGVGNRFSTCTIDGVRRFNRGDQVSWVASEAYRWINPYHKSTYMFLYRL